MLSYRRQEVVSFLPKTSAANLVTFAGRSTGFAGIGARRSVRHQVCVRRTLCALAGTCVYVMSRWARHTCRAGRLRTESTNATPWGHSVHRVTHRDGVDSCHVAHIPTYLRQRAKKGQDVLQFMIFSQAGNNMVYSDKINYRAQECQVGNILKSYICNIKS